ncbi:RIP metalloprotease [Corynebacterium sp. sy039]|uniref:M50 family metallopeptidase n=1 Tax=Corynebacterium sp. sy039 TaxID=2599641 RepID=UPI0011B4952A|nr:site-2 protease family protein [Corynebacterium sp. sy039]QDZ42818.1 site-2 protease family protein [Corynebacterium sp. sy039]
MATLLFALLFAVGIAVTVGLHEWGHYMTARMFGMRVRQFFIGFGPKLFSYRRGQTEYGIKAILLGGYCDIAGMTNQDPFTQENPQEAMAYKPWWQRIIVLLGGIIMNIIVAFVIFYAVAVSSGLPNPHAVTAAEVGEVKCVSPQQLDAQTLAPCQGEGPAQKAGVQAGDRIIAIDGKKVEAFTQIREYVQSHAGRTIILDIERDDQRLDIAVPVEKVTRLDQQGNSIEVGAIGVSSAPITKEKYNAISGFAVAIDYTRSTFIASAQGLVSFPAKIPSVVTSIFGGEREKDGPVSVVGISRIGGELAQRSMWDSFFLMLASLNIFLALFNLLPLPPLDGGHIAVVLYEKIRDALRKMRGKKPLGPADYTKITPVIVTISAVLLIVGVIVIAADIVNPIRLFG